MNVSNVSRNVKKFNRLWCAINLFNNTQNLRINLTDEILIYTFKYTQFYESLFAHHILYRIFNLIGNSSSYSTISILVGIIYSCFYSCPCKNKNVTRRPSVSRGQHSMMLVNFPLSLGSPPRCRALEIFGAKRARLVTMRSEPRS